MILTTGKEELVEDVDDTRDVLRMIFELYGAKVRTAGSAEEGKRLLAEDRPDIMISDIAMPDDGIELIRAVKASADAQDLRIPVIAITAHRYRGDELRAEGIAGVPFLSGFPQVLQMGRSSSPAISCCLSGETV